MKLRHSWKRGMRDQRDYNEQPVRQHNKSHDNEYKAILPSKSKQFSGRSFQTLPLDSKIGIFMMYN